MRSSFGLANKKLKIIWSFSVTGGAFQKGFSQKIEKASVDHIPKLSFKIVCATCFFLSSSAATDQQIPPPLWSKFQFQNLDQALTSKSQPNISISTKHKILTKPSFRILTKIRLRSLNQTPAAKY